MNTATQRLHKGKRRFSSEPLWATTIFGLSRPSPQTAKAVFPLNVGLLELDFRVEGRIESKRFTEKRSATSYSVSVRSDQTLGEIV